MLILLPVERVTQRGEDRLEGGGRGGNGLARHDPDEPGAVGMGDDRTIAGEDGRPRNDVAQHQPGVTILPSQCGREPVTSAVVIALWGTPVLGAVIGLFLPQGREPVDPRLTRLNCEVAPQ
jgi:hypothetical protein